MSISQQERRSFLYLFFIYSIACSSIRICINFFPLLIFRQCHIFVWNVHVGLICSLVGRLPKAMGSSSILSGELKKEDRAKLKEMSMIKTEKCYQRYRTLLFNVMSTRRMKLSGQKLFLRETRKRTG